MAEEEDKEEEEQQKNTCSTPEVSIGCCPEAVPDAMGPVLAFFFAPPPSTAASAFAFPFPPAVGMVAAFLAGSSCTASAFSFPFPPPAPPPLSSAVEFVRANGSCNHSLRTRRRPLSAKNFGPGAMPTRCAGAVAAACLFLLGRAGAFHFRAPAPVPVVLRGAAACRARCTGARQHAVTASIVQLSARSESWSEEDEVVCDRILSSIERAHARPDARLEHDDEFLRAPKDGELFDLMQSVLLKVARPAFPWHVCHAGAVITMVPQHALC